MTRVDLNCDLGEGAGHDAEIMPLITSANVACGAHAGNLDTMRATVELAERHGVAVGAHPAFADPGHFGRRELSLPPGGVKRLVYEQVAALARFATLSHVKPHGALYNLAARDARVAAEIAEAVYDFDPSLVLVGLAGSDLLSAGRERGLRVASEVFADRTYQTDGSLTPRSSANALIGDEDAAVKQALGMVLRGSVRSVDGETVSVVADTICLHGDSPHAAAFARRLRDAFRASNIEVGPLRR